MFVAGGGKVIFVEIRKVRWDAAAIGYTTCLCLQIQRQHQQHAENENNCHFHGHILLNKLKERSKYILTEFFFSGGKGTHNNLSSFYGQAFDVGSLSSAFCSEILLIINIIVLKQHT